MLHFLAYIKMQYLNIIILDHSIIRIIFFLFKINPKIPIKNKNNDRFIVMLCIFVVCPCGIIIKAKF